MSFFLLIYVIHRRETTNKIIKLPFQENKLCQEKSLMA